MDLWICPLRDTVCVSCDCLARLRDTRGGRGNTREGHNTGLRSKHPSLAVLTGRAEEEEAPSEQGPATPPADIVRHPPGAPSV